MPRGLKSPRSDEKPGRHNSVCRPLNPILFLVEIHRAWRTDAFEPGRVDQTPIAGEDRHAPTERHDLRLGVVLPQFVE